MEQNTQTTYQRNNFKGKKEIYQKFMEQDTKTTIYQINYFEQTQSIYYGQKKSWDYFFLNFISSFFTNFRENNLRQGHNLLWRKDMLG